MSPSSRDVCPWWLGYLLAAPWRKLWHDPRSILRPFLGEGMTVLEPGPGMGFFTLEMARLVGPKGRVDAVDIPPRLARSPPSASREGRPARADRTPARARRRDGHRRPRGPRGLRPGVRRGPRASQRRAVLHRGSSRPESRW